jgi:D-3-phosphoglycerate dehydrogenase / 2-oxoglutarate reductase
MTWKVLVSAPYMQPVLDRFRPIFEVNNIEIIAPPVNERLSEEELLPWVGDIDGAICGDDRFTERVLEAAPKLKVISKWGTGIDSIDQAAAQRLDISVRNTPNAFSEPVADSVLGYLLCFARQIPWMDREIRAGCWRKLPSFSLQEATLGVIGVGNVGKTVVRRAVAFKMRILGHDVVDMPADFVTETGIEMVSKEELLHQADFISLNCTLNPTSFHLMSDPEFAVMKPTAYLINTARGPLIDEPALVRALQAGQLAGAALDVFEVEPLPEDSPLRSMDNVLLAPHNSNSSPAAWERVHHSTINNLLEELRRSVHER